MGKLFLAQIQEYSLSKLTPVHVYNLGKSMLKLAATCVGPYSFQPLGLPTWNLLEYVVRYA